MPQNQENALNFVSGAGVKISAVDNSPNNSTDVTIAVNALMYRQSIHERIVIPNHYTYFHQWEHLVFEPDGEIVLEGPTSELHVCFNIYRD
jgi:hypothetical protein